jgi:putative hemolysin
LELQITAIVRQGENWPSMLMEETRGRAPSTPGKSVSLGAASYCRSKGEQLALNVDGRDPGRAPSTPGKSVSLGAASYCRSKGEQLALNVDGSDPGRAPSIPGKSVSLGAASYCHSKGEQLALNVDGSDPRESSFYSRGFVSSSDDECRFNCSFE